MNRLFTCLLLLTIFNSCNNIWNKYEPILRDYPDSTLALLTKIAPNIFLSSREKADYSLLLSMALDKCYIDIVSDSLITPAVSYYAKHKPLRKRMLAYYYLGRVQSNANAITEASFSFEKAEGIAYRIQDYHYLGLINQQLGDLYAFTYDREHLVFYYKRALEWFEKDNNPLYIDNARIELAIAYNNNNQPEDSEALFQELLKHDSLNSYLRGRVFLSYARKLSEQGQAHAHEALLFFKKGDINTYGATDFGAMAMSAALSGDTIACRHFFSIADSMAVTETDRVALDFFRYKVHHHLGNDSQAIRFLERSVTVQDSILRVLLNQSVSAARSAYYKNEAEKQLQRNRIQTGILVFVIACGILIILWLVLRHRNRIRNDMALIGEARQKLEESYHERNLLANSIINHQINELHLLTEEYYKSDSPARREKYFRAFEKRLDEFRSHDADLKGLEQSVNQLKGNAMKLLREEYPNETRHFYRMCTLFFAGLPYDMIHLLTKSSIPTLKAGKSHIRKQILSSNTPHQELFLSLLDSAEKKPAGRPKKD